MARRCGCASDSCSCTIVAGQGMTVTGSGSDRNPYVITSNDALIQTGINVQYNNVDVIRNVHRLDFRGAAVHIDPGSDEAVVTVTVPDPVAGVVIPTGCIYMFGMSNLPSGWLLCSGQTVLISAYPALFAAIGTNFGGDGTSSFGIPSLSDRFPVGASASKPINNGYGGSASHTIQVGNLPPHQHSMSHDHPAVNSGMGGSHDHNLLLSSADGTAGTVRRGTGAYVTGGGPVQSGGGHVHPLNVANFSGVTGGTVNAGGVPIDHTPYFTALAFGIKT